MTINELTESYLFYWGNDDVVTCVALARFHLMMAAVSIAVLRLENRRMIQRAMQQIKEIEYLYQIESRYHREINNMVARSRYLGPY